MAGLVMTLRSWAAIGLLLAPVAHAQETLTDPTRPANAGLAVTMSGGGAAAPSNELQSILLVPGRKPRALLAGQWCEEGQLYAGSRVVKITAGSVILRSAEGGKDAQRQVLTLTPGIEKARPAKEQPKRAVEIK